MMLPVHLLLEPDLDTPQTGRHKNIIKNTPGNVLSEGIGSDGSEGARTAANAERYKLVLSSMKS